MRDLTNQLFFGITEIAFSGEHRIFWGYLLSSLGVAAASCALASNQKGWQHLRDALRARYWLNRSSWHDLQWLTLNKLIGIALILPLIGGQLGFSLQVLNALTQHLGPGDFWHANALCAAGLLSFILFIGDDFSRYALHRAYHRLPCLWRFHAVHHSATSLTPLTLYRVHPLEYALNTLRSLVVVGTLSGVFLYTLNGSIGPLELLGANMFSTIFNIAGANLRHSHFRLGFGRFERWFISPAQHQIHHSAQEKHFDRNFGSALAIWDRCFGSWMSSKGEEVNLFGLTGHSPSAGILTQILGIDTQPAEAKHHRDQKPLERLF